MEREESIADHLDIEENTPTKQTGQVLVPPYISESIDAP